MGDLYAIQDQPPDKEERLSTLPLCPRAASKPIQVVAVRLTRYKWNESLPSSPQEASN